MLPLEKSPLWGDILSVINAGSTDSYAEFTAILHTPKENIEVSKILSIDFVRDYVHKVADEVFLEAYIPMGEYVYGLIPNKNELELTLYRKTLRETSTKRKSGKPEVYQRYRVVFIPEKNPDPRSMPIAQYNRRSLNIKDIVTVNIQLMSLAVDALRLKTTGGSYKKLTRETLIKSVLSSEISKTKIKQGTVMPRLDVVKPDNTKSEDQMVIPDGTKILSLPTYVQEKLGGVYTAGVGTYIQHYNDSPTLFVYPLYNSKRKGTTPHTVAFYNVPKDRYQDMERTYTKANGILKILCTGKHSDQPKSLNKDQGFRMIDSDAFLTKPVTVTEKGPVADRGRLMYEAIHKKPVGDVAMAPHVKDYSQSNVFAQSSRVLEGQGGRVDILWENSQPDHIYPGAVVKYYYLEDDVVKSLQGVVGYSQSLTGLQGRGIGSRTYGTVTSLSLFTL